MTEDLLSYDVLEQRVHAAVERVATAEPRLGDPFHGLFGTGELSAWRSPDGVADRLDDRLAAAARLLGLGLLETAVLGLAAAPELDPRYGRLFGYLQDDLTRTLATPRLLGALLAQDDVSTADVLTCLAHGGRLLAFGALRLAGGPDLPAADRTLKVADPLAAFLLGAPLAARLRASGLRRCEPPADAEDRHDDVSRLQGLLEAATLPLLVMGTDAPALLARAAGRGLLMMPARTALDREARAEGVLLSALERRLLVLDRIERLDRQDHADFLDAMDALPDRPVLCASGSDASMLLADRTISSFTARPLSYDERLALWRRLSGAQEAGDVAAKFRLSAGQIAEGAQLAVQAARARGGAQPDVAELDLGAREASSARLGELATRLQTEYTWSDLVVPDRQIDALHSILGYLRHRDRVLVKWGYENRVARNQGVKILCAGDSGTGKTLAAQILANELGLELFLVNLATVVSKYVGETEKNLGRVFAAAEGSNAMMFFDEADALFGKRSEVRDAHDRYANIEVAYLLQRIDAYAGAVILSTNFRRNVDDAFLRRLDFVIDFPFPEAAQRERLWRQLIPAEAPLAEDVDPGLLAKRFKLSGGGIRNCTLAAAFLAAEEDEPIGMSHLVRAVGIEYGKLGRLTIDADFEGFEHVIRRPHPARANSHSNGRPG